MPLHDLLLANAFFAILLILALAHSTSLFLEALLITVFSNVYWGWYIPRCQK